MLTIRLILAITLGITLSTSLAIAEPKDLTRIQIEQWMTSQQPLEAWGKKHAQQLAKTETNTDEISSPMDMSVDSMVAPLKSAGLYASANKMIQEYGFEHMTEWAEVTLRITRAIAAIQFENQPEIMDTSELEALKNSPQVSKEQKAMLTQAIEKNKKMVQEIMSSASQSDKTAIKPFLPRIMKLMDQAY